jgi:hypothetical protein
MDPANSGSQEMPCLPEQTMGSERTVIMNNPECCGQEMVEIESVFTSENGESEGVIGYKCTVCGCKYNLQGEEI